MVEPHICKRVSDIVFVENAFVYGYLTILGTELFIKIVRSAVYEKLLSAIPTFFIVLVIY